jgi:hypothetical protein
MAWHDISGQIILENEAVKVSASVQAQQSAHSDPIADEYTDIAIIGRDLAGSTAAAMLGAPGSQPS